MISRILRSLFLLMSVALSLHFAQAAKPVLKCRPDGTFKVLMMSDVQDDATLDPRATALMEKLLDTEKPDFVVLVGDNIAGYDIKSADEVHQAIASVAAPMEKRQIPWAMVYGNHDQQHFEKSKLDKDAVLKIYQSYAYNRNVRGDKTLHGVGNSNYLIMNTAGKKPVFNLWLFDSGEGRDGVDYDWIHWDQVDWYVKTSQHLEKKYKGKIPGLMFFHIPLREFTEMTSAGKFTGDRNEVECPSKINSGLFAAVLDRGDVKGIFSGHDHTNNYAGDWHGVKLGYDTAINYASYNLEDTDPRSKHSRGGRVFLIQQSDPWNYKTWMRYIDGTVSQDQ